MKSEHAVDHKALGAYDFWIAKYGCRVEILGEPGKCIDDCINFVADNLKYLEMKAVKHERPVQ
jgi:hypothetical protein